MKNFTMPFLAGVAGAVVALGIAITSPPKAEAGGIYWNNHGGGGVVIHRARYHASPSYYNYAPGGLVRVLPVVCASVVGTYATRPKNPSIAQSMAIGRCQHRRLTSDNAGLQISVPMNRSS